MIGAGFVILGVTLLEIVVSFYQTGCQNRTLRWRASEALEDFRKRAFFALAKSEPERSGAMSGWNGTRKFYVARKVAEAKDVWSFYLRPYDGKPVPLFVPGQHLTIQLTIPDEPRPAIRCYSVSDAPLFSNQYRITIKRLGPQSADPLASGGLVSNYFQDALPERATLNVRAPSGRFYLDFTEDRPVVMIAGGIGVTPIVSMLKAAATFGQPAEAWLFYGVRDRREHAFYEEIHQAAQKHGKVRQIVCYSRPSDNCVKGRDYHHRGHVTMDLLRSVLPHRRFVFYLCGPASMMEMLTSGLRAWGVPDKDIRTEAFGANTIKAQPEAHDIGDSPTGTTLPISFTRSRMTLNWTPECRVLLELAEKNGVNLHTGCRAGQCGTCMVSVSEGKVRHIVEPGMPLAEGFCLPCVAVPESKLVLDL